MTSLIGFYKKNRFMVTVVLFSLILILLSLSLLFLGVNDEPVQEFNLNVTFEVSSKLGFDVNDSVLSFGIVPGGSKSTREVMIDNGYNFPVEVIVFASEDIAPYLLIAKDELVIGSGESLTIPFILEIPSEIPEGSYLGNVRFELWRVG